MENNQVSQKSYSPSSGKYPIEKAHINSLDQYKEFMTDRSKILKHSGQKLLNASPGLRNGIKFASMILSTQVSSGLREQL